MQALASSFAGVRLTPARSAPVSASRRGVVCVAEATAELNRLPAATLKKIAFDGAAKGDVTLSLKTAPEDTAKGLVHRYLVMVRQNARRVRTRCQSRCRHTVQRVGARDRELRVMRISVGDQCQSKVCANPPGNATVTACPKTGHSFRCVRVC